MQNTRLRDFKLSDPWVPALVLAKSMKRLVELPRSTQLPRSYVLVLNPPWQSRNNHLHHTILIVMPKQSSKPPKAVLFDIGGVVVCEVLPVSHAPIPILMCSRSSARSKQFSTMKRRIGFPLVTSISPSKKAPTTLAHGSCSSAVRSSSTTPGLPRSRPNSPLRMFGTITCVSSLLRGS
jgi:hypothetical protein